jgi:hypothetical protein
VHQAYQADQWVTNAPGLLRLSQMELYWSSCLNLGVFTKLTFEISFPGKLTWLWMVSLPICLCKMSMDVTLGCLVIILNTLFWKTWRLIMCFGRIPPPLVAAYIRSDVVNYKLLGPN